MQGPVRPDRVRCPRATTYGWVDHGLRAWLGSMSADERSVYLFLILVADRRGVSWYGHGSIGRALTLDPGDVRRAVAGLCALDLVAYSPRCPGDADGVCQILAVPGSPPAERREGAARSLGSLLRDLLRRDELR